MNELAHPLQSLLAAAAKSLPRDTGETEGIGGRFQNAGTATILLCDVSSSMNERAGSKRKIDHLRAALDSVWSALPRASIYTFSSHVANASDPSRIGEPSGGTALHMGLGTIAGLRPARTIVISDGRPDDEVAALAAAEQLSGTIDVIYCGPDDDAQAITFMRSLARVGCGRVIVHDLVKHSQQPRLAGAVRQLLALPAPR